MLLHSGAYPAKYLFDIVLFFGMKLNLIDANYDESERFPACFLYFILDLIIKVAVGCLSLMCPQVS